MFFLLIISIDFIIESIDRSEKFISKFKLLEENRAQEEERKKKEEEEKKKKEKENTCLFKPKVEQTKNINSDNNKEQKYLTKKKRGRKNKKGDSERPHGKNSPDNIIKKCKRIFFKYIIIFFFF